MFIFDMCERGVQLTNPFYSIWVTETGKNLALAFIILAGVCASVYFFFLCFMVFKVFRNISGKRASLPTMSDARRLHYEGLIYRFKFLMLFTLLCAATTVIFFIISQRETSEDGSNEEIELRLTNSQASGNAGELSVIYKIAGKEAQE
ncbi:hypothetical protein Bbelb_121240 [Branchiostoma belcheri]|nr:hypothetical protein Bbelb_121240 [Branchiostoma belcheri]